MKIYTKITINMETGKTVEEEFFEYSGPVALCIDGPSGLGGPVGGGPSGPGDQAGPAWPYNDKGSKSSKKTLPDEEEDSYEKMLQMFFEMFEAVNSGAYNQTGQLVGGRGNVGSTFSYMPQMQKDKLNMQLKAFAPWMEDYKWNNPQATDDDDGFFGDLMNMGMMVGAGKLFCWVAREVYGEKNPKEWLLFACWMHEKAPRWFRSLYFRYGERFAKWISDKPRIKWIIRRCMDSCVSIRGCRNGIFAQ